MYGSSEGCGRIELGGENYNYMVTRITGRATGHRD